MGLALTATGFGKTLHIGYGGFSIVRKYIALAYSKKHGEMYSEMLKNIRKPLPEDFDEKWNEGCNDDLDILLWHSDCDGRLTPQECRKIYRILEKMNVEFEENIDYYEDFYKNFVAMLKHCYQRRVIMFFC